MKNRKIKALALLLALVMVAAVFAACNKGEEEEAKKDTLIVGIESDPRSLDPAISIDVHSASVTGNIYETLLALDANKNIIPKLAEYKQIDDITYEFYVKKGVKFHNGEELKAADVVFTFQRGIETPQLQYIFDQIDASTIVEKDEYPVWLQLRQPSASFLSNLTSTSAVVVNKKAVTEYGEDYPNHPIGTGPMKFVSWEKNVECIVERFEDYYGPKPEMKKIIFRPIVELTSRTIELESGAVDMALGIPATDLKRVEDHADLRIESTVGYSMRYVGFNCSVAPFDNELVRQALSHAVDAEGIAQALRGEAEKVTAAPYSHAMMYYDESVGHISYDPALAKQLLAEAGYPDGFKTTIVADERKERTDIATIVQQQLAEIGVTAEIKVMEWGTFLDATYAGNTEIYVMGWSAATPDPDYVVYNVFHSSMQGEGGNMSFVNDPRVDDLIERGRTSSDFNERAKIYAELQALLKDLCPWIYLYAENLYTGVSEKIDHVELQPSGVHPYYAITFK